MTTNYIEMIHSALSSTPKGMTCESINEYIGEMYPQVQDGYQDAVAKELKLLVEQKHIFKEGKKYKLPNAYDARKNTKPAN